MEHIGTNKVKVKQNTLPRLSQMEDVSSSIIYFKILSIIKNI